MTIMRFLTFAALLLGAAACSFHHTVSQTPPPQLQLDAEEGANWDRLERTLLGPFHDWQNGGQHSCSSPELTRSADGVLYAARGVTPDFSFKDRFDSGSWVVEVADGAKQYGCAAVARPLYNYVLETYNGEGFGTLRTSARLGLQALGAAPTQPQASQ